MTVQDTWEAAEIGRFLYAHKLDPDLAARVSRRVDQDDPDADQRCCAALVLNVLVRVEIRCGHDPVAIRAALDRPLDMLSGDSIADRLRANPDLTGLRLLREAAGTMPVPKVKMWRVPDRYS